MLIKNGLAVVCLLGLVVAVESQMGAQQPAAPQQGQNGNGMRRMGGFVPGQKRAPEDPARVARGQTLYAINCRGCHGADLRGGDMGGPNLLRSQVALSDQSGELILPIIQGSRQSAGMPAIGISPEDGLAVAAYVRSIIATIGTQGKPPSEGVAPVSVLVGDANAGKAYFASKCSSCHSVTGDLQGIATKFSDAKALQNAWVSGSERHGRGAMARDDSPAKIPTVAVTLPSGEKVEGKLIRIDDFFVTVGTTDGSERTFRRDGDVPKVEVHDPMKTHRDLWAVYTDKDMHDVTAYLVTLK